MGEILILLASDSDIYCFFLFSIDMQTPFSPPVSMQLKRIKAWHSWLKKNTADIGTLISFSREIA